MYNTSEPIEAIWAFMLRFNPSISETIAMMLVTPMMTPSTVRNDRSLFVRIAWNAIEIPSRTSIATGYSWRSATIGSSFAARVAG